MSGITQANFSFHDFRTTGGEVLPEVTLAYVTRGTLAPDGRNAILITHGYTSGPTHDRTGRGVVRGRVEHAGRSRRADRYRPIFCRLLQHAWVPAMVRPTARRSIRAPGKPYGSQFPRITVEDIVTAQKRMLDGLGVKHLRAVVGPSYGGFQAFQWGVTFPDFMDGIVPVVTSPRPPTSDRDRPAC